MRRSIAGQSTPKSTRQGTLYFRNLRDRSPAHDARFASGALPEADTAYRRFRLVPPPDGPELSAIAPQISWSGFLVRPVRRRAPE